MYTSNVFFKIRWQKVDWVHQANLQTPPVPTNIDYEKVVHL